MLQYYILICLSNYCTWYKLRKQRARTKPVHILKTFKVNILSIPVLHDLDIESQKQMPINNHIFHVK